MFTNVDHAGYKTQNFSGQVLKIDRSLLVERVHFVIILNHT